MEVNVLLIIIWYVIMILCLQRNHFSTELFFRLVGIALFLLFIIFLDEWGASLDLWIRFLLLAISWIITLSFISGGWPFNTRPCLTAFGRCYILSFFLIASILTFCAMFIWYKDDQKTDNMLRKIVSASNFKQQITIIYIGTYGKEKKGEIEKAVTNLKTLVYSESPEKYLIFYLFFMIRGEKKQAMLCLKEARRHGLSVDKYIKESLEKKCNILPSVMLRE